ncbi:hypothetical protein E8E14_005747 [Neopestalotiopsis sp. 37M]|nr:hypothetical protein E8E14_005747 [Neopestalotiopsis sp. 37M]
MAEIYAKASRVVVWLENTTGEPEIDKEAYNDSAQALEIIGSFATRSQNGNVNEEAQNRSTDEWPQNGSTDEWTQSGSTDEEVRNQAVVQEVAAARHVLIKCHLAEIDGYAFCLGLEKIRLGPTNQQTRIRVRSAIYLIRDASLRPKRVDITSASFSLQIWPLMNLIELYSVREATDRRDKVYALLGMSVDMPTDIVPDYRIAWADLFSQLVKSALPDCISVNTWNKLEIAVIRSKGCVLGRVHSTHVDNDWIGQQEVMVNIGLSGSEARWVLHASARLIQENDIVCFLQGASLPTIVRVYDDYCDIIAIAASPIFREEQEDTMAPLKTTVYQEAGFPTEFLLVWNWDTSFEGVEELSFESFMMKNSLHCAAPCKADRLMNVASLCRALGSDKEAISLFSSILKLYEDSSQRNHPTSLAAMDALLEIHKAGESLADAEKVKGLELMANILNRSEGFVVMNEDLTAVSHPIPTQKS